ncbi:MAG: Ig-like domain-containing protein [Clostridium sp.]|nr:Ig-like domain-containing protein [Clostridium sp.]
MRKKAFATVITCIFLFSSLGGGSVNAMELMTDTDAAIELMTETDAAIDDDSTGETDSYVESDIDEVLEDEFNVYASYSTISSDEAYNRMIAIMPQYPTGMTWTNDNSYTWNCGWQAWGCMGFAHLVSDAAFGNAGFRTLSDISGDWFDAIRVGDVLRVPSNHSVTVLQIYDDYVVVAEGNASSTIRWGRTISKDTINSECSYIETRYAADAQTITISPETGYRLWMVDVGPRCFDMEIGDTYKFSATITPKNSNATIQWTSSNPDVAEVSQDGTITGKYVGKAVITATYMEAGVSSSYEVNVMLPYSVPTGIFFLKNDHTGYIAGITTTNVSPKFEVEYSWYAKREYEENEECISDWTYDNEWLNWTPKKYGNYTLIGKTRVDGDDETIEEVRTDISYSPYIKGKCQMPYTGEGGGYLIGFETYDNPGQKYRYEILILDCTLLAEGKDAWIYTTTQCGVEEGNAFWTIWQPKYGYYWTLFRLFDEDGNLIDEQCYGFQNI